MFEEKVGLLQKGTIASYDPIKKTIKVQLNNNPVDLNRTLPIEVELPHTLFYNNGLFIGTAPVVNTPVIIERCGDGKHYFVSFLSENKKKLPLLSEGELLIRANDNTKITLNLDNNISIGSSTNKININTKTSVITNNFINENHFTYANRKIEGLVKRDLKNNDKFSESLRLEDDSFDTQLSLVGLDPTASVNNISFGSNKNPPLVESRELIYEFQPTSNVSDDITESQKYNKISKDNNKYIPKYRRTSKADTLSLTLLEPNYLMETIKGTVVDVFGNILDLNRNPLPIGQNKATLTSESSDKIAAFKLIKELQRKSIAYHFEINTKKDLTNSSFPDTLFLPDFNSNADYSRNRSRLFLDIDKEGQFKLNIPASSEKGNIALLTRYENFSSVFIDQDGKPSNKLIVSDNNKDILQESFASTVFNINAETSSNIKGSIKIISDETEITPKDRITNAHIRHGTAYHDILATCFAHQKNDFIKAVCLDPSNSVFNSSEIDKWIKPLKNVVSDTIYTSGPKANAGGRSGTINFDGSIEMNVGANTVDRQSLWLDTAGGLVANIGRDLQHNSAIVSMDGDMYLQVGGFGVNTDSRFKTKYNGKISGTLDIRVFHIGNMAHMIRIDESGIKILTPGNLSIHSQANIKITSNSSIDLNAETVTIQNRAVDKFSANSI